MKIQKNINGFTVLELLLVVLIVVVICAAGYLIVHRTDKKTINNAATTNTKSNAVTELFPTKKLSYQLPTNFKQVITDNPNSGVNGITEEYEVDINSEANAPSQNQMPCTDLSGCSEPLESVTIQDYILNSANLSLEKFVNQLSAPGLSGEYLKLDGLQAYCQQSNDGSQKQLASLPTSIPWQIFWGYGCNIEWGSRVYQVNVTDNGDSSQTGKTAYLEAIGIIQSIKFN